jgi:hypothetical protein
MPDKDGNITIHDVQVACGHICEEREVLKEKLRAAEAEVDRLSGLESAGAKNALVRLQEELKQRDEELDCAIRRKDSIKKDQSALQAEVAELREMLLKAGLHIKALNEESGLGPICPTVRQINKYIRSRPASSYAREAEAAEKERIEAIAEQCHNQWSGWTKHLLSKLSMDGLEWRLLNVWVERWNLQIETPYAKLSEEEKDSDRRGARKIVDALVGLERARRGE